MAEQVAAVSGPGPSRWTVAVVGHRFESLAIEREVFGDSADVVDGEALDAVECADLLKRANAVLLGSRGHIGGDVIRRMPHCRVIARYGIGVDNVDAGAATERGVLVTNVPDYCVDEVATHTVALILAASRRLPANLQAVKRGDWSFAAMKGAAALSSQTVGLVGFGRIGRAVADKLRSLVEEIVVFDEMVDDEVIVGAGATAVLFDGLVRRVDYLSLHCPLTDETRGLVDAAVLEAMKPDAWLINTARGEIVNEKALIDALKRGVIGGAALDVLSNEPPEMDHPLLHLENAIVTPHVAHYSERAMSELQRRTAEAARTVLEGAVPESPVNPEVTSR